MGFEGRRLNSDAGHALAVPTRSSFEWRKRGKISSSSAFADGAQIQLNMAVRPCRQLRLDLASRSSSTSSPFAERRPRPALVVPRTFPAAG